MKSVMIAGALLTVLGGCATTGDTTKSDPLEDVNRSVFAFNLAVDKAVIEPVSEGYSAVTPRWGRDRVSDFFQNLGEPLNFANSTLQGDFDQAAQTGFRFVMNSTVGLVGLFDVAQYEGFEVQKEDFGQTLAVWGVDSGPYIVLPLLGPSNPRDAFGGAVSAAADPLNFAQFTGDDSDNTAIRAGMGVVSLLNTRVAIDPQIEQLRDQLDPYVAAREISVTRRNAEIRNGQESQDLREELPDFEDF